MEPYKEPSAAVVGIYILDASDDVINAADAITKFLELDCKVYNQQLEQKVPISQSITKIVLQMQQSKMYTHLYLPMIISKKEVK